MPVAENQITGHYVTLRANDRTAFLLGPYATHLEATVHVDRASRIAQHQFPASADVTFGAYGTTRVVKDHLPDGQLNGYLNPDEPAARGLSANSGLAPSPAPMRKNDVIVLADYTTGAFEYTPLLVTDVSQNTPSTWQIQVADKNGQSATYIVGPDGKKVGARDNKTIESVATAQWLAEHRPRRPQRRDEAGYSLEPSELDNLNESIDRLKESPAAQRQLTKSVGRELTL